MKLITKLFLLVAFFLLGNALLNPNKIVGVADNGDFWRVTNEVGLVPAALPGRFVVNPLYVKTNEIDDDYFSSTSWLAGLSKMFSFLFGLGEHQYSIQQMGFMYLLALIVLAIGFNTSSGILSAVLLLPFLDSRYFIYFNSFFSFPLMFLVLYGLCFFYLSNIKKSFRIVGMIGLILLGFLSAHQFMLLPAVFIFLIYCFMRRQHEIYLKRGVLIASILLVSGIILYRHYSNNFSAFNNFDSVFSGPTLVSESPDEVLKDLGVDKSLWRFANSSYFSDEVYFNSNKSVLKEVDAADLGSVSKLKLAMAYFRDYRSAELTLSEIKSALFHYHSASHGSHTYVTSPPDQPYIPTWSLYHLRQLVGASLSGLAFFSLVLFHGILLCWLFVYKRSSEVELGCFLFLFSVSQVVTCVLGSGLFALGRHLLVCAFSYDLSVLLTLFGIIILYRNNGAHSEKT